MFYRRKILLALLELLGGRIGNTDFEKLLFLYCQSSGADHYDFFPYRFGAFSFTSYYDKGKLISGGWLKDVPNFELAQKKSPLPAISSAERLQLNAFVEDFRDLRGRALIRKTYIDYPFYAIRSEILNEVLSPAERESIEEAEPGSHPPPTLFTIGYEGRTIDAYLRELIKNGIKVLVDVRRNPLSRKHGFSKRTLSNYVEKAGLTYVPSPELGIASARRRDLVSRADYQQLFAEYARDTLPEQTDSLERLCRLVAKEKQVAITCFERDHDMCHRHVIANHFAEDGRAGFRIVHI